MNGQELIRNMVKVYPNHLKVFQYHKPYIKADPTMNEVDRWAFPHQYHQKVVRHHFPDDTPTDPEFLSPDFLQAPMPFHPLFKHFQHAYDKRMGIHSENQLQALIERDKHLKKSLARTRTNIFDIIACNVFEDFVTFSFGEHHYDIEKCQSIMKQWLDDQQKIHRRKGLQKFEYILVPEYHKDRRAIHFHGLFKNYRGKIRESRNPWTNQPVIQKGKLVYNISSFRAGFTNLTKIVNHEATARYVSKYVTKDIIELHGQKRYWTSQGLKKPDKLYNEDLDGLNLVQGYEGENFTISTTHDRLRSQTNERS